MNKNAEHIFLDQTSPTDVDVSRRGFLKLMGASMALAGATACRFPEEKIVPANGQPEGRAPGEPVHYMTAMDLGGSAIGLKVTSFDGRPIKIEGNPNHPINQGSTHIYAQAALLDLYDPARSKTILRRDNKGQAIAQTWDDFLKFAQPLFEKHRQDGGKGLRVLSGAVNGPSMLDMQQRFGQAFPQAKWYEYEAVSYDNEREATRTVFDEPQRLLPNLLNADVIVSFDADFLHFHPASLKLAREFAERRRAKDGKLNKLYMVEPAYSLTGAMADEHATARSSQISHWPIVLLRKLAESGLEGISAVERQYLTAKDESVEDVESEWIDAAAKDLLASKGRCLVMAGPGLDHGSHQVVQRINQLLGAFGNTLQYAPDLNPGRRAHWSDLYAFIEELKSDQIETLLILDCNIAYATPQIEQIAALIPRVKNSIHLGSYHDETAGVCKWHVPQAHFLESWGDATAADGTVSIVQPLIAPLYGGKSALELVALVNGDTVQSGYEVVKRTFAFDYEGVDPEAAWQKALTTGIKKSSRPSPFEQPVSEMKVVDPRLLAAQWDLMRLQGTPSKDSVPAITLTFRPSYNVYDGRFARNAWLQEVPDPMTKIVWDNAALVSAKTARENGWSRGTIVTVKGPGRLLPDTNHNDGNPVPAPGSDIPVQIPVLVQPGVADGTLVCSFGYGRRGPGSIDSLIGANSYALSANFMMLFRLMPASDVTATNETHPFSSPQDSHAIDLADANKIGSKEILRRLPEIFREVSVGDLAGASGHGGQNGLDGLDGQHGPEQANSSSISHSTSATQSTASASHHDAHEAPKLWRSHEYTGHRWGMAVDLTACIGCNACVVACYAENNIPVVGKDETQRGRDMAWLRVDRYFAGDPEDANSMRVLFQPVACQHCETAPCEQVCPVGATVHDNEGLNAMVYNRCVGTRYCSNNCPYKVRRFNYFNNQKKLSEVEKMKHNPDVTVRSRGVMEKCSYCVQRVIRTRIDAKNERRPIEDGEIQTACQQVCPTKAIVFGDLNNRESEVARLHEDARAYALLGELNTRPRTMYLAKIKHNDKKTEG